MIYSLKAILKICFPREMWFSSFAKKTEIQTTLWKSTLFQINFLYFLLKLFLGLATEMWLLFNNKEQIFYLFFPCIANIKCEIAFSMAVCASYFLTSIEYPRA